MSLLDFQGLEVAIRGQTILRPLNFQIQPGEIYGLVGESGSGKSMTALAAMGLLPNGSQTRGKIELEGQDLLALPERRMRNLRGKALGMIFQEPMTALNPVQPVGQQVAETLLVHGVSSKREAMDRAGDRLERVGLAGDKTGLARFPHELSGGQRQRVCIAMAIALRPKLLIADEPTTALDVSTQAQILELLKELVEDEGMALMLITHDLAVVAQMAQRVAVMNQGEIVEQGRTEDVFCQQSHPYTRRLFAASTHKPARAAKVEERPVLAVEGLSHAYPKTRPHPFAPRPSFQAVDAISFQLRQGESLGLVGESGCGKSTLSRLILGLEPRQQGNLSLDDQSLAPGEALGRRLRRSLQVVFQDPAGSFNPRHRVERIVAEPFHLLDKRPSDWRARVEKALLAVGLSAEDRHKFPHEFSGGQRQRIAIARALIIRPKIIVLDEAVSALDVSIRATILDLLADLQREYGLAYLFISHDLSVVEAIADRVMVMRAGQIVEHGPTADVMGNPQHPYTRALLAAVPRIPDHLRPPAQTEQSS